MNESLVFRFWDKFDRPEEGCWEWKNSLDTSGYGLIRSGYGRKGRKLLKAHRLAWMLWYGPIPKGMIVCHKCDNPKCVRPDHLFVGTKADNAHDRDKKGRHKPLYGEDHPMVKLTWKDVLFIRKNYRGSYSSIKALATKFGISIGHTYKILGHGVWKKV